MADIAPVSQPAAVPETSRPQQPQRRDGALDLTGAAIIKPASEDGEASGKVPLGSSGGMRLGMPCSRVFGHCGAATLLGHHEAATHRCCGCAGQGPDIKAQPLGPECVS